MKDLGKDMEKFPGWEKLVILKDFAHALNHVTEPQGNIFSKHVPTKDTKNDLIIIFDDNGYGELADYLRNNGFKVVGGGRFADRVENDRQFATDLMKKVMDVPESVSFTSWDRAIEFVKNNDPDDKLVFKPNDSDVPKEYTYVAKNVQDMVDAMQNFKSEWKWAEDFQIQRFIKGIEVDFNAYFNGTDFLPGSFMIYFENKPLMPGDIGPATGGSIAVQFPKTEEGAFYDILDKLKPLLKKVNYRGCFAINAIVSEEDHKPYFLETTPRFGYPSLPLDLAFVESAGKTAYDLIIALAEGKSPTLYPKNKIAVTAAVFIPPAPNPQSIPERKGQLMSWDRKYDDFFFPYFIMYKKGMVITGIASQSLQVVAIDSTLAGAISTMYDTYLPALELRDAIYRNDCGEDAKKRIKQLQEWGSL
jgi:phosphoribosylamine-glycine ligase